MIDESIVIIDEEKEKIALEKNVNYYVLLDFWMQALENKKHVRDFFIMRNYKTIAIYGMAVLGKHLQYQLQDTLDILYTIDRKIITYNQKQYSMEESIGILPKPDVIVVTPVIEYANIKENISRFICTDIISIEEVILSL